MSTIRDIIGEERFERVRGALSPAFPDGQVTDAHVHAVVHGAWLNYRSDFSHLGISAPPEGWTGTVENWWHGLFHPVDDLHKVEDLSEGMVGKESVDAVYSAEPLYVARADHQRVKTFNGNSPFQSAFMAELDMVRVALPATLSEGGGNIIKTRIGQVDLGGDHLLGSIDQIAHKFGAELGYVPARVDMLTPPRIMGMRVAFGATLYFGYRNAGDTHPAFYIAEGGMPTGEPKTVYLGKTIDTVIKAKAGFKVSPYASPDNEYIFNLQMTPGAPDEPERFSIEAFRNGQAFPYIKTTVRFSRVANITARSAAEILLEAVLRVSLLGNAMGFHVFGAPSAIQDAGARISHQSTEWEIRPPYRKQVK